jgi:DNA-binding response OmpR family regulator
MKKKILVIEDDNILQAAIKDALADAGFDVVQAFDGDDGFKKAESEKPDLVLLDLLLPKKDGYHILYDMTQKMPDIPVIVLTVIATKTSIAECVQHGAKGYLTKGDYSLDQIVEKVKKFV